MNWLFNFDYSTIFNFTTLLGICFGSMVGLLIGALPGLGPTVGIALLLPLAASMDPIPAIAMLIALYQCAEYSGAITAIVIGIPGTSAAVPTVFDGYPMAKQGKPGKAVGYSLYTSAIGGFFG
jgi:putative tricarboxylic transport membrane protein